MDKYVFIATIVFIILSIADTVTTAVAISMGYEEANIMVSWLVHTTHPAVWFIKDLAVWIIMLSFYYSYKKFALRFNAPLKLGYMIVYSGVIIKAVAPIHNTLLLLGYDTGYGELVRLLQATFLNETH